MNPGNGSHGSNGNSHIAPLTLRALTLPVIVTDGHTVLEEPKATDVEPFPYRFRPDRLRELAEVPHLWASMHPAALFMAFYDHYKGDRDFTFEGSVSAKELRPGMGMGTVGACVRKIGFKRTKKGMGNHGSASRGRRVHYLLDLRGFIVGKHVPPLEDLFLLAKDVRDFCDEMGIGPKLNFAGIASAMLRHPQFYPEPRKRVPEYINEKSRLHLPGNHYDLFTDTGRVYKAARYYDQRSAHHHAALLAPMPTSDSLRSKGYTKDSDHGGGRVWLTPDHPGWERTLNGYGLFMARVKVPRFEEDQERYLPHSLRVSETRQGVISVGVWSSELSWLREIGVELLGIEWALTGDEIDHGIRRFAEWALEEAQRRPHFKPTLLCTYGLLAQRRGWSRSLRGVGPDTVRWDMKTFKTAVAMGEPEFHSYGPTNVVQRGIIEAYTRMLTLRYVRHVPKDLQLGLYGDAVIIDVDGQDFIAPVEEPWREKGELSNLKFLSATQFESDQLTRLPGVRPGMRR